MISTIQFCRLLVWMIIGFLGFSMWQAIPTVVQTIHVMGAWSENKLTTVLQYLFVDLLLLAGLVMGATVGILTLINLHNKLLFSQFTFLVTLLVAPTLIVAYFDNVALLFVVAGTTFFVVGLLSVLHWRYRNRLREVTVRKQEKWEMIRSTKVV